MTPQDTINLWLTVSESIELNSCNVQCCFIRTLARLNVRLVLLFRYAPYAYIPSSTQHRLTESPTHTTWSRSSWIILEVDAYMAYHLTER
jgi:hypothetical protein